MTEKELISITIKEPDEEIRKLSSEKWDSVAKPIDGLGCFEDMVSRIAAIQGTVFPELDKKAIIIMCADNGVYCEGVSQTGQEVTGDVAALMGMRKSSVGIMAQNYPVDFHVYDIGINSDDTPEGVIDVRIKRGTGNFAKESAMTVQECLAAIDTGIRAARGCSESNIQIIATGEMGIGNTTTSTALLCAIRGLDPKTLTGRGAGLSDSGLERKIRVIEKGLTLHRGDLRRKEITEKEDVLKALADLGGLDIAGLTGVFIGAAMYHIPVVIDGLISAVAALIADRLVPGCRSFMLPSHMGREKGMEIIMDELSLKPVISAGLALGEGTGALFLFPLLDMALSLYLGGTSFAETQIDQYERFDK